MKTRKQPMPIDEMHRKWPSLNDLAGTSEQASASAWVAVFDAQPEAMHRVVRELIKQVYAKPNRTGQRPMPREEQVDFWGLIHGDQTDLPIHEALPKLTKLSERQVVSRIAMSRTQYQRLLKGEYDPTIFDIREIARVVGKPPTYFIEYRKMMAVAAFINLLDERPGIASTLYRDYLAVRA